MNNRNLKSEFESALQTLSYRHDIRNAFEGVIDAILYNLIALDNAGLRKNPFERFKGDENTLVKCIEVLGELMENGGDGLHDALGDLFMEYLSFGKNGQFFTPQPICDMMAIMSFTEEPKNGQTVCDPACGSGRLLLGAAKRNRELRFYGSDVDLLCVKMTVLNLALNNLRGEIVWGNPLSLEVYGSFIIEREIFTGFPIIYTQKTSAMFGKLQETLKQKPAAQEPKKNKPQQLTLFD